MLKNIQTDPKWANEDMGMICDKIGFYGCFVVACANILDVTPSELNHRFKVDNCYNGQQYPGEESELNYTIVRRALGISFRRIKPTEIEQQHIANVIICIKSRSSPSGIHFVNTLAKTKTGFTIFDVFDGKEKEITQEQIVGAYVLTK